MKYQWEAAREAAIKKVRGRAKRSARTDSPMTDEAEAEKSFWLSRPDGWVIKLSTRRRTSNELRLESNFLGYCCAMRT